MFQGFLCNFLWYIDKVKCNRILFFVQSIWEKAEERENKKIGKNNEEKSRAG